MLTANSISEEFKKSILTIYNTALQSYYLYNLFKMIDDVILLGANQKRDRQLSIH